MFFSLSHSIAQVCQSKQHLSSLEESLNLETLELLKLKSKILKLRKLLLLGMRFLNLWESLKIKSLNSKILTTGSSSSHPEACKIWKISVSTLIGEDLLSPLRLIHSMIPLSDGNLTHLELKIRLSLETDPQFSLRLITNLAQIMIEQRVNKLVLRNIPWSRLNVLSFPKVWRSNSLARMYTW